MARAVAGDIVSLAGFTNSTVSHTLNEQGKSTIIKSVPIDPPMMFITINVNTSPLAGKEGDKLTKSKIRERLIKEAENDVALRVIEDKKGDNGGITVQGRGDLHLGLLIEKMRREGFEMEITPPEIIIKKDV